MHPGGTSQFKPSADYPLSHTSTNAAASLDKKCCVSMARKREVNGSLDS